MEHRVAALTQQILVGPGGMEGEGDKAETMPTAQTMSLALFYHTSESHLWSDPVLRVKHPERHGPPFFCPPLLSSPLVPIRRPCCFRPTYHVIFFFISYSGSGEKWPDELGYEQVAEGPPGILSL